MSKAWVAPVVRAKTFGQTDSNSNKSDSSFQLTRFLRTSDITNMEQLKNEFLEIATFSYENFISETAKVGGTWTRRSHNLCL
jgi:hypothetical protein